MYNETDWGSVTIIVASFLLIGWYLYLVVKG